MVTVYLNNVQTLRSLTSEMTLTLEVDEKSDQEFGMLKNGGFKCDIMGYSPMISGFCQAEDVNKVEKSCLGVFGG